MFFRYYMWCMLMVSAVYGQNAVGGRYLAMGNTGAALQGVYSLNVNQAGVSALQRPTVALLYQNHFFNTDIHTQAVMLGVPTRLGVLGVAASRYALTGAYTETKLGFAYGRRFGKELAVALGFNYHQLRIPNYGGSIALSVDIGLQYRLSQQMIVGVHYANLGNLGYGTDAFSIVPSVVRGGATYDFAEVVSVSSDVVYYLDNSLDTRVGLEYRLGDWFCFRGGISINPMQQYVGFGVQREQLAVDLTAAFHERLGMSPQISVAYAF